MHVTAGRIATAIKIWWGTLEIDVGSDGKQGI